MISENFKYKKYNSNTKSNIFNSPNSFSLFEFLFLVFVFVCKFLIEFVQLSIIGKITLLLFVKINELMNFFIIYHKIKLDANDKKNKSKDS